MKGWDPDKCLDGKWQEKKNCVELRYSCTKEPAEEFMKTLN